jgi:hypothetical protein
MNTEERIITTDVYVGEELQDITVEASVTVPESERTWCRWEDSHPGGYAEIIALTVTGEDGSDIDFDDLAWMEQQRIIRLINEYR